MVRRLKQTLCLRRWDSMDSTMSGTMAWNASEKAHTSEFVRVTVVDDNHAFVALLADLLGDRFRVTGILPRTISELG